MTDVEVRIPYTVNQPLMTLFNQWEQTYLTDEEIEEYGD